MISSANLKLLFGLKSMNPPRLPLPRCSDCNEPDGTTSTSVQAQWLQASLAASTAVWKFVLLHHSPYSSGSTHGTNPRTQWPFEAWGAHAVFSGHDHVSCWAAKRPRTPAGLQPTTYTLHQP